VIDNLKEMLTKVAEVKEKHGSKLVPRPS